MVNLWRRVPTAEEANSTARSSSSSSSSKKSYSRSGSSSSAILRTCLSSSPSSSGILVLILLLVISLSGPTFGQPNHRWNEKDDANADADADTAPGSSSSQALFRPEPLPKAEHHLGHNKNELPQNYGKQDDGTLRRYFRLTCSRYCDTRLPVLIYP